MTRTRAALVGLTVVLLGMAGLVLLYPAAVRDLAVFDRLRTAVEQLREPELIVFTAIGLFLLGYAVIDTLLPSRYQQPTEIDFDRRLSGLSEVQTGNSFDTNVDALTQHHRGETRDQVRARLRSVATTVLTRATGLPTDTIEDHLENGTWTADVRAAVYFTDRPLPFTYRLRDWLAAENTDRRQIDHVIHELEMWQFDDPATDTPSESEPRERSPVAHESEPSPDGGTTTGTAIAEDSSLGRLHRVGSEDSVTASIETQPESAARDSESDAPATEQTSDSDDTTTNRPRDHETVVQTLAGKTRRVRRQEIGITVAFFATGLGLALRTTAPLLVAVVGTVYAAHEYFSDVSPPSIRIERELATRSPVPGDRLEVAVRLTNTGDSVVTDLRYIDGVPDSLAVVEGSPATHTALRPGETWEFDYTIKTKRGAYEFGESELLRYSISGIKEWHTTVQIDSRIEAATILDDFPIAENTFQRIGTVETDEGGSGIEFHSVREYQTGDPLNRIDWNQLAKTGSLSTINFRRQRGTTVVLFLDARDVNEVAASPDELDGLDLSIYAAEQVFHALQTVGTEIGLFQYTGDLRTIEPDTGDPHRESVVAALRARSDRYASIRESTTLQSSPDQTRVSRHSRSGDDWFEPIARQLPRTAQIVLFSPVVDETPIDLVRQFRAYGHPVSLVSPNVTVTDSFGCRVSALERDARVRAIRETGAYVADWDPNTSLQSLVTQLVRYHHH